MALSRTQVYMQIDAERDHQDNIWGGVEHDQYHELGSWISYMQVYLRRAQDGLVGKDWNYEEVMSNIKKATALGVACMEYNEYDKR